MLIDPVREHVALYLSLLDEQGLTLRSVLETHVHADHITAAALLHEQTGAQTIVSIHGGTDCADVHLRGGETLHFGAERIVVLATRRGVPVTCGASVYLAAMPCLSAAVVVPISRKVMRVLCMTASRARFGRCQAKHLFIPATTIRANMYPVWRKSVKVTRVWQAKAGINLLPSCPA